MKKTFLLIVIASFSFLANAQIVANDSLSMGAAYANMVFYQLSTGNKQPATAADWHVAFTVQPTQFPNNSISGVSIRINEAYGVKCYLAPALTPLDFATLDTTGYTSWSLLHDSDKKINEGALNSVRDTSDMFDFGWGTYNSITHVLEGSKVFLFELSGGVYKKLTIDQQVADTAFDIRIADLDNGNLQNLHLSKADFPNRFFSYLNLVTGAIANKEPVKADWDLLFIKYSASDVVPGSFYNSTGVWIKPGVTAAKATGVDVNSNDYTGVNFSADLNTIGWNWKTFNQSTFVFEMEDSLVYFIEDENDDIYKVVFTSFGGSATGNVSFYKEKVFTATTGINKVENAASYVAVYPNPAQNNITVITGSNNKITGIELYNEMGQMINVTATNSGNNNVSVDISHAMQGVYFLKTTFESGSVATKRVVVY